MKFYVAAVRNWDEKRMENAFDCATEIGSGLSWITNDYKTLRGLLRYNIYNHHLYHSHVWAVFRCNANGSDTFLGIEYNSYDQQLKELATRYMRVRNRMLRNPNRHSGYPLSVRTG